ncbi:TetR/AcrR family transcriptional regulator [Phytopseudomonas daroniae]|uniref:TetR/AcrR family transcriptional regulator n=1 Tax=Phytopseudomonas daroniae TaxID=2487519 RepID=UPI0010385D2D|nr:TetR/AcrR family transcriptional regulator [Pseudomonas daroniae]TBU77151.1 transcriptional regulator [Pseudomonas daroniae]
MDRPAAEEKLLKALAVAIVEHPRGTFKEIAQAAGVSKATLNRFCGTRDNLIEMLFDYGSVVMNQIIADADLQEAPPQEALQRLVDGHLAHRELLVFLIFQWRPDSLDACGEDARWLPYTNALDQFFLRGQRENVFRIDIGAPVLTELFASLLFGLVDGERRGRVARAGMGTSLMQFFMRGAAAGQ